VRGVVGGVNGDLLLEVGDGAFGNRRGRGGRRHGGSERRDLSAIFSRRGVGGFFLRCSKAAIVFAAGVFGNRGARRGWWSARARRRMDGRSMAGRVFVFESAKHAKKTRKVYWVSGVRESFTDFRGEFFWTGLTGFLGLNGIEQAAGCAGAGKVRSSGNSQRIQCSVARIWSSAFRRLAMAKAT